LRWAGVDVSWVVIPLTHGSGVPAQGLWVRLFANGDTTVAPALVAAASTVWLKSTSRAARYWVSAAPKGNAWL